MQQANDGTFGVGMAAPESKKKPSSTSDQGFVIFVTRHATSGVTRHAMMKAGIEFFEFKFETAAIAFIFFFEILLLSHCGHLF